MSVTNKELEGRFIADLRPELRRRDVRTQAPDMGDPPRAINLPWPHRWRHNASERSPIKVVTLGWQSCINPPGKFRALAIMK